MPRVVITAEAARGLEKCRRFLAENSPDAVARAGQTILLHFRMLEAAPAMRCAQAKAFAHRLRANTVVTRRGSILDADRGSIFNAD